MIRKLKKYFLRKIKGDKEIEKQYLENLRDRGAIIGESVHLINSIIDGGTACLVEIGSYVTITNARIYAHDASTKMHLGYTKVAKTKIGDHVFIGAGSIILPGVTIGSNVIIGAGSVVRDNIPDNSVVMGNPANIVCTTEEYISRNREKMKRLPVYNKTVRDMDEEERRKMCEEVCKQGGGYEV